MATVLHVGLLGLLAIAPLPLGGNRPAAWSFLALWCGVLLAGWALLALLRPASVALPARRFVVLGGAFALVMAWAFLQTMAVLPTSMVHPAWPAAANALATALPGSLSAAPDAGPVAAMRLAAYAGIFWLAAQLGRDRRRAGRMIWAIALIGCLYAGYGLFVQFGGHRTLLWLSKWAYLDDVTSTFVNRNSYATYAGLGLLAIFALLRDHVAHVMPGGQHGPSGFDDIRVLRAGILAVLGLVLATALLLTHSRAGVLATLFGLVVLLVGWREGRSRGRTARRLFTVLALGAVLLVAIMSGDGLLRRLTNDPAREDTQRVLIWRQTLQGIADRPLLGHGYGAYETAFAAYQDPREVYGQRVDKAHNTYLELTFELGLPAALLLLALPGLVLLAAVQAMGHHDIRQIYPTLALASGALVGSHALVDFSVQIPAVAMTWAALLGTCFAQSFPGGERRAPTPQRRPA